MQLARAKTDRDTRHRACIVFSHGTAAPRLPIRFPATPANALATHFATAIPRASSCGSAAELERIGRIVIPPAWEKVWICLVANGHLQATGRDARGRKQYRYHPDWTARTGGEKFDKLAAFGNALPGIRQRVQADLGRPGVPRETVLAAVVQLLDRTALRIGNSEYARSNGSYGLTTLLNRHVAIDGGKIQLRFRGKSGIWQERWVNDARPGADCRPMPGTARPGVIPVPSRRWPPAFDRLDGSEWLHSPGGRRRLHGQGLSHLGRFG